MSASSVHISEDLTVESTSGRGMRTKRETAEVRFGLSVSPQIYCWIDGRVGFWSAAILEGQSSINPASG